MNRREIIGLIPIAVGVVFGFCTLRCRRPKDMLASTYTTLMKLIRGKAMGSSTSRKEPFISGGPYQYVRNPLYFSVAILILGFGIALSSVLLLLWNILLICWFWFFLIPFEKKELETLFGEDYAQYKRQVPKLFPCKKR